MRILHYSLGFPPERSGGLIRYTIDLMNEQVRNGDEVYYLSPQKITIFSKKTKISEDKDSRHKHYIFHSYSLINSLPLPIFGGIRTPADFMKSADRNVYLNFLNKIKPDVIHIHTLMGLHKEFFECAQSLNIKIIFTTHDYFGVAPEPTFFYEGENYDDNNTLDKWMYIGSKAIPTYKLRIFQLKLYPTIRYIMHKLNVLKNSNIVEKNQVFESNDSDIVNFKKLRTYYKQIFSMIDYFHFNSTLAKTIYSNYLELKENYQCISITNSSIHEYKNVVKNKDRLRIGYIGPYENYKGFFEFLKLPELLRDYNFEFHIFGSDTDIEIPPNVENHGRFKYSDIDKVYNQIDLLIVPSICKETFGFIIIEALCRKTMVIASQNVGAKDLLDPEFVYSSIDNIPKIISRVGKFNFYKQKELNEHYLEINNIYLTS